MPIQKSLEETMPSLQENQKLIEEHDEKARQALWGFWLDKGLWHYKEAAMLVACGATRCIDTCVTHMGTCHCECCVCFNSVDNDRRNIIRDIISLFEAEDWATLYEGEGILPERISPFEFTRWAMTKKSIVLPQELALWYRQKTEPEDTAGPNVGHDSTTQFSTITVPRKLFDGKSLAAAFKALEHAGFANEVIAYILKNEMGAGETEGGRFFSPENEEKDEKTYRNRLKALLRKAKQKYIIQVE